MVKGATFTENDIPFCPTTATELANAIVTWEEAKTIYRKHRIKKDVDFNYDAYVCWYIDDYKFDGPRGIWHDYNFALKVLCHFAGVITPDFSTYQDFPEPLKIYNTYRMRAYGYWLGKNGIIAIINNVRWGTSESYRYCFDGIPQNSIIAIGTCGGSPKKYIDRRRFENGLAEMVKRLNPHTIIVYGSAKYYCFGKLKEQGINIIDFPSQTANREFFYGKSVTQIDSALRGQGYQTTIRKSKHNSSRAKIIVTANSDQHRNITQVQVSPGSSRHGNVHMLKLAQTMRASLR